MMVGFQCGGRIRDGPKRRQTELDVIESVVAVRGIRSADWACERRSRQVPQSNRLPLLSRGKPRTVDRKHGVMQQANVCCLEFKVWRLAFVPKIPNFKRQTPNAKWGQKPTHDLLRIPASRA
jgi:hypothetical protein